MSADSKTPPSSDDAGATGAGANPFAAGLGLFQDWMKAAGSAMPNMGKSATESGNPMGATLGGMSGLGAWTMPTLDPQELEKRITDLKTVQFWLEQNARMIAMTIQGLEVQRMTLSTLKGMNVSMDALRESLKARAAAASAPSEAPAPEPAQPTEANADATTGEGQPGINPMQWWDTLTQQFTQLASQAAQASVDVGSAATNSMAQAAEAAAAGAAEVVKAAAQPVSTASKKPATKAAPAKKAAAKRPATKVASKRTGRGQAD